MIRFAEINRPSRLSPTRRSKDVRHSLVVFAEAYPWAESLRAELLSEIRPTWHPDNLSAREVDTILVWASGGTPEGSASNPPPLVELTNAWALGEPELALPMPSDFILPADLLEDTQEFIIATGIREPR